jgi:hypothetical protein
MRSATSVAIYNLVFKSISSLESRPSNFNNIMTADIADLVTAHNVLHLFKLILVEKDSQGSDTI